MYDIEMYDKCICSLLKLSKSYGIDRRINVHNATDLQFMLSYLRYSPICCYLLCKVMYMYNCYNSSN